MSAQRKTVQLCLWMALCFMWAGIPTARADVFNGVNWGDNVYDPGTTAGKDGLPTDPISKTSPAWTGVSNAGTSTLELMEDFLRLGTGGTTIAGHTTAARSFSQTNGFGGSYNGTIEFRVRINEINYSASYAAQLLVGGGSAFFEIALNTTQARMGGTTVITPASPMTQWHTFRVTLQQVGGGGGDPVAQQVHVYLDNDPTPVYTGLRNAASGSGIALGLTYFRIGDSSTSTYCNGVVDYDYVRWTTAGVFAPVVPEPSTLGLLALGAVTMFRRGR